MAVSSGRRPCVSAVIITLDEEKHIERIIGALQREGVEEIIVADGGSEDRTVDCARAAGASVVSAPRMRSAQMNIGAACATGEVLWFLHADSEIYPGAIEAMGDVLSRADAGAFRLRFFDSSARSLRAIAFFSDLRARYFRRIFSDQGLFLKRSLFGALGGFLEIPLMEDLEFSRRLFAAAKVEVSRHPIGTSARRYLSGGIWRTQWKMHMLKWRYRRGEDPASLKEAYDDKR